MSGEICPICGRVSAEAIEEWDDAPDALCMGDDDPLCEPPTKFEEHRTKERT